MARTVGTEALRRLAFLAGGTGGRGTGAPTRWAPTWFGGGARRTLAWTAQTCCGAVDFMAPWRVVRWQPDSLSFLPLPDGVVGDGEEAKDAAATLQALHELAGAVPEEAVLGYPGSGPVCGERTLATAQKLSERTNRARIISICPLHNIVGV